MATVIGFGGQPEQQRNDATRRQRNGRPRQSLGEILSLGVIPRMLLAHSEPPLPASGQVLVQTSDVERLAPIALTEAAHVLLDHVEAIMRRGASAEEIFVHLLAPIARWMGREWEEDRLTFVDVSMGLWRLQEVTREIAASAARADLGGHRRSALFSTMPGDQHGFGAAMLHECFAIAGWESELIVEASTRTLIETVAEQGFDLLGLSIWCDCDSGKIADLIRSLRSVSKNPDLIVMIGGRVPQERPNFVALCGANATAATAPEAVKTANRLMGASRIAAIA